MFIDIFHFIEAWQDIINYEYTKIEIYNQVIFSLMAIDLLNYLNNYIIKDTKLPAFKGYFMLSRVICRWANL